MTFDATQKKDSEEFFIFDGENGTNKLFLRKNKETLEYHWQRENERCSIVLKPLNERSSRAWIILTSAQPQKIAGAMEMARFFLDFGDHVIITTDTVKNTVEKYENQFELWHEYRAHQPHKFDGYNVNCVACELLLSERLAFDGDIDFASLVQECGGTIANAEWGSLPVLADTKNGADFPCHALPAVLGEMVQSIAKANAVRTGLVATTLIGSMPAIANDYRTSDDGQPVSVYTLSFVGTGQGKTTIFSHLVKPYEDWDLEKQTTYNQLLKDYNAQDEKNKADEPIKPAFTIHRQMTYSIQGFILLMMKQNIVLCCDEARSMLNGQPFQRNQREQTFGFLCSFWSGISAGYQVKDISMESRRGATLSMNLSVQSDFMDKIDSAWYESGFLPRFLIHREPDPSWGYRERTPLDFAYKTDEFGDNCYRKYSHTITQRLLENENPETDKLIKIDRKISDMLGRAEYKYMMMTDDNYPSHHIYRRKEIYAFICRSRDHIKRIACLMMIYDGKKELTEDCISRASLIFDYYLSELISIVKTSEDNGENKTMLDLIYRLSKDGDNPNAPLVSLRQIQTTKIFRSVDNPNVSIKSAELLDICERLQEFGFIKIKKKGNKTLVKIHPKYRP